jgi:hypothetical protein
MRQDPATFNHAQARIAEMLTNALHMERESIIKDLAAELTSKEAEVAALTDVSICIELIVI